MKKKKLFGVYYQDVMGDDDIWYLHRSFHTMESALDCLKDKTRLSFPKYRQEMFVILPMSLGNERVIKVAEEFVKPLMNASK